MRCHYIYFKGIGKVGKSKKEVHNVVASKEVIANMLKADMFPLSSKYDPYWLFENQMGPNPLWLTEWLAQGIILKPGMRVLDMGCGKALSSIFLAKEFGVDVWAVDLWVSASDNWKRICDAGVADKVFPINAEAHALPFANEFFDAGLSVDSYLYYGTDDIYLNYFEKFVKRGSQIGIVMPGLMKDFEDDVPLHLTQIQENGNVFWKEDFWFHHTINWWRHLWTKTHRVNVEIADTMHDGWKRWIQWENAVETAGMSLYPSIIESLEKDKGNYIGFIIARNPTL